MSFLIVSFSLSEVMFVLPLKHTLKYKHLLMSLIWITTTFGFRMGPTVSNIFTNCYLIDKAENAHLTMNYIIPHFTETLPKLPASV